MIFYDTMISKNEWPLVCCSSYHEIIVKLLGVWKQLWSYITCFHLNISSNLFSLDSHIIIKLSCILHMISIFTSIKSFMIHIFKCFWHTFISFHFKFDWKYHAYTLSFYLCIIECMFELKFHYHISLSWRHLYSNCISSSVLKTHFRGKNPNGSKVIA